MNPEEEVIVPAPEEEILEEQKKDESGELPEISEDESSEAPLQD